MRNDRRWALFIALVCVATLPALAFFGGGDDDMPTFRSDQKRESKEFVTKVGEVIVMAARSRPKKIELTDFAYTTPKPNRKELTLKMTYTGAVTRVKFTVEIAMLLDTEDKDRWEVLNIRYSDSNKSPVPYSEKKVQNLIKQLNK